MFAEFVLPGSKLGHFYTTQKQIGVVYVDSKRNFEEVSAEVPTMLTEIGIDLEKEVVSATISVHAAGARLDERLTLANGKQIHSVREAHSLSLLPQVDGSQSLASVLRKRVRQQQDVKAESESSAKRARVDNESQEVFSDREDSLVSQAVAENGEAAFLRLIRNVNSLSHVQLMVAIRKHVRDSMIVARLLTQLMKYQSVPGLIREAQVLRITELLLDAAFVTVAVALSKSEDGTDELIKVLSALQKQFNIQAEVTKGVKQFSTQLGELLTAAQERERAAVAAAAARKANKGAAKKDVRVTAPVRMLEVYKMRI